MSEVEGLLVLSPTTTWPPIWHNYSIACLFFSLCYTHAKVLLKGFGYERQCTG